MSEERIAIAVVALVLGVFALVMSGVVGRKVRLVATWSTAVLAAALLAAAAMPGMWLLTGVFFVRAAFPSLIYWGDHDAFKKCTGAIAQPANWPAVQWQACDVMRMCANEAPLGDDERKALYDQLQKKGCEEP
jgi:type VI protein secretion system component VasK